MVATRARVSFCAVLTAPPRSALRASREYAPAPSGGGASGCCTFNCRHSVTPSLQRYHHAKPAANERTLGNDGGNTFDVLGGTTAVEGLGPPGLKSPTSSSPTQPQPNRRERRGHIFDVSDHAWDGLVTGHTFDVLGDVLGNDGGHTFDVIGERPPSKGLGSSA
jgi:hypothetical protein